MIPIEPEEYLSTIHEMRALAAKITRWMGMMHSGSDAPIDAEYRADIDMIGRTALRLEQFLAPVDDSRIMPESGHTFAFEIGGYAGVLKAYPRFVLRQLEVTKPDIPGWSLELKCIAAAGEYLFALRQELLCRAHPDLLKD